jgi:hypothetical protein
VERQTGIVAFVVPETEKLRLLLEDHHHHQSNCHDSSESRKGALRHCKDLVLWIYQFRHYISV